MDISDEQKKFNEELEKLSKRLTVNPDNIITYTPTPKKRFSFRRAIEDLSMCPPFFLVIICKILKPIFTLGGFIFLMGGGLYCLLAIYNLWTAFNASGWQGLLSIYTLHIILYFVLLWIINTIRFFICLILDNA